MNIARQFGADVIAYTCASLAGRRGGQCGRSEEASWVGRLAGLGNVSTVRGGKLPDEFDR